MVNTLSIAKRAAMAQRSNVELGDGARSTATGVSSGSGAGSTVAAASGATGAVETSTFDVAEAAVADAFRALGGEGTGTAHSGLPFATIREPLA